ncbi:MAG: undecaprenyldiphospho-muramoylpentapeptide beta-N-acetylglucosaminyltransferase [Alphaproteobacteria bacterium]
MTPRHTNIVLAAGGTGGHMFPAEALAGELNRRGFALALITDRRGASFGEASGVRTLRISAGHVSGSVLAKIKGLAALARGTFEAGRLLRELDPAVVVGFGGYASVPTMLAATRAGLATVLHEQNAVLGRANRLLAHRVDLIATSFEYVEGVESGRVRLVRTGNPVRPAIAALSREPYPMPQPDGPLHVLVTGGSQGAAVFGQVVPQAVALLPPEHRARISIVQQCRAEDLERAKQAFAAADVRAELAPFLHDMSDRLRVAQLVICRAGASTVAELSAAGRPAILVPFPQATDDHQTANAMALAKAGGAVLIPQKELTAAVLAQRLTDFLTQPGRLVGGAAKSRAFGIPEAAERLAETVAEVARKGGNRPTREAAA